MIDLVLNVLWVVFGGGLAVALAYFLVGALLCVTVVGIPFGVQCFKIGGLALWPFGRDLTELHRGPMAGAAGAVFNVIWVIVAGIWIFLGQLGLAIGLALTVIGIPFAVQHVKLAMLALFPFGKQVR